MESMNEPSVLEKMLPIRAAIIMGDARSGATGTRNVERDQTREQ